MQVATLYLLCGNSAVYSLLNAVQEKEATFMNTKINVSNIILIS